MMRTLRYATNWRTTGREKSPKISIEISLNCLYSGRLSQDLAEIWCASSVGNSSWHAVDGVASVVTSARLKRGGNFSRTLRFPFVASDSQLFSNSFCTDTAVVSLMQVKLSASRRLAYHPHTCVLLENPTDHAPAHSVRRRQPRRVHQRSV
jgi:hypothetical protein